MTFIEASAPDEESGDERALLQPLSCFASWEWSSKSAFTFRRGVLTTLLPLEGEALAPLVTRLDFLGVDMEAGVDLTGDGGFPLVAAKRASADCAEADETWLCVRNDLRLSASVACVGDKRECCAADTPFEAGSGRGV